jgi:hypothetical protein
MSGVADFSQRPEGDEWEDLSGKKWKKVNGVKVAVNKKATLIYEKRCTICRRDTRWGDRYDHQVWPKSGKCYNCFIEFETELKKSGIYKTFIRNRDLNNLKHFLVDLIGKLNESIAWCNDPINNEIKYVNDDGTSEVETWKDNTDAREIIKRDAERDLQLAKDRLVDIDVELSNQTIDLEIVKNITAKLQDTYKNGRPSTFSPVIKTLNLIT